MEKNRIPGLLYHPVAVAGQALLIYAWLSNLPQTDGFFSVYCCYGVVGLWCLFWNFSRKEAPSHFWGGLAFSTVFALSVILGNYRLFQPFTALMSLFNMGLCFGGGCVIGLHILLYFGNRCPMPREKGERKRGRMVFFLCFGAIVAVDLTYLFTTSYPAIIHYDTMSQLKQALGLSPYSSWTPYWHTKTLGFFLNLGMAVFEDVNQALALCEVAQVLFLAAVCAYSLTTLYRLGLPKVFLGLAGFLYVLLPYNIVYNVTLLKDVSFGGALLLFTTAWLRILTKTGKRRDYILFGLGGLGFCLWRTNGWFVYLLTTLLLLPHRKDVGKALLLIMGVVLAVEWFLNGPYLETQEVEEAPFTEMFAVPFQQIGRVIVEEREIPEADAAFLSEIFRMELVQECYRPETADPMKFEVFRHGNMDFLKENLTTFLKIWLRLGIRYPGDYLLAWVDETRGYWNGGYNMGVFEEGIPDNTMGMAVSEGDNPMSKLFGAYIRYVEDPIILEPLKSIGFSVWLVLGCWWSMATQKRKVSVMALPTLVILLGLWIGTPVFAEFRYGYPIFLVSPMIGAAALFDV